MYSQVWSIQWRLVNIFLDGETISQTILHNKSNPLPSVFLPEFSSQTDIGVEIV